MWMKNKGHHGKIRQGQLDSATVLRVRWEDAPHSMMGKSESESHSVMSNSLWFHIVHGILQARILEWVAFPFSRGSSQPRIEPRTSTLLGDSIPAEPQGKPKKTGVASLSLLTQESNWGHLHCRQILYQLSYQGSPPWWWLVFKPTQPCFPGVVYTLKRKGLCVWTERILSSISRTLGAQTTLLRWCAPTWAQRQKIFLTSTQTAI